MKFQVLVKRRIDRGLEGSSQDPRFKQNTARDSGNVKRDTGFDQNTVRDSGNVTRDMGFDQNTVRDSGNVKRDTGFDQNTVRDSGNVKWDTDSTKLQRGIGNINGIRDLTATLKAGFIKIWAEGSRIGKENDIRDSNEGSSRREISVRTESAGADAASGSPFPDPT